LGSDIGRMSDESLQQAVYECDIFAKLSPLDKERVVKALKATGRTVGFLGDGVNDAAALKAADVGISVDNAVEIAKESADVILMTKSLDVLDRGVLLGRISFANIIKYIKMAASSNFGNMFSILGLSVMLPVTPLQPVQILVNNLLYDFSQIALPFDSVDDEWVERPRQWDMKDLATFIMLIGPTSSVFDYMTWAMSWYILGYHADTPKATVMAQTVWWMESLFSQTLIVHLIRTKNSLPSVTRLCLAHWHHTPHHVHRLHSSLHPWHRCYSFAHGKFECVWLAGSHHGPLLVPHVLYQVAVLQDLAQFLLLNAARSMLNTRSIRSIFAGSTIFPFHQHFRALIFACRCCDAEWRCIALLCRSLLPFISIPFCTFIRV